MNVRLKKLLYGLNDTFWLVPGLLVLGGISLALALVELDHSGVIPQALIDSRWLYSGGATGARTLLGSIASSTISTAGTIFSITIAAPLAGGRADGPAPSAELHPRPRETRSRSASSSAPSPIP